MRAAIVLVALCLTATRVAAQQPPTLAIESPPDLASAHVRLDSYDVRPLAGIVRLVGLDVPGPPIRVVLAAADSDWARQVPPWTAGFAIGSASLIVLFPSRSPTYPHDTLEDVLRHEVTHILISRAASGRPVPRWFHEGLAVAVERAWELEDRSRLALELLLGPRLTFREIDDLFSGGEGEQSRAYSLAAAAVRDLIDEHGTAAPAAILRALANDRSFDAAIASVTARSVPMVEAEFWNRQQTWTVWIPLVTSTSVVWLGVMGLAALAVRRRRLRAVEIRRRWASEEAEAARPGRWDAPGVNAAVHPDPGDSADPLKLS